LRQCALKAIDVSMRLTSMRPPARGASRPVARCCRNLKRWGGGQMVLRWVASSLTDAASRVRKLRGCSQMRTLLKALDARRCDTDNGLVRRAA
jgi:hypothetical protein